jgi:hypothetical protein
MKKKVYIAGKVTGESYLKCIAKFYDVQQELQELNYIAVNPLEVVNDWKTEWKPAMKKCINALMECDAVLFLPDWKKSQGAKLEMHIAEAMQLNIYHSIEELYEIDKPLIITTQADA